MYEWPANHSAVMCRLAWIISPQVCGYFFELGNPARAAGEFRSESYKHSRGLEECQ
jgi:hypothetical protein